MSEYNVLSIFATEIQVLIKMTEYIKRNIDKELIAWKEDSMRKPLLLRGARQVGKSSAVRHFGKEFKYFAEVNFEKNKSVKTFFLGDIDVHLIAQKISSYINVPIEEGKTLLFLDEIQECPKAIMALRFFKEKSIKVSFHLAIYEITFCNSNIYTRRYFSLKSTQKCQRSVSEVLF